MPSPRRFKPLSEAVVGVRRGKPTMVQLPPYGLAAQTGSGSPKFLSLKSVKVNAKLVDVYAHVELIQTYLSLADTTNLVAKYVFPVPRNAAVCGFKMESSDGVKVKSIVREVKAATDIFAKAQADGKWAGFLKEIEGDVFSLTIGAIPAKQDIRIFVYYISELEQDELNEQVRFSLPTYIRERYGTPPADLTSAQSPREAAILEVNVQVQMSSPITSIHSPSHMVMWSEPKETGPRDASLSISDVTFNSAQNRQVGLNSDFVLCVTASGTNKPRCIAEIIEERRTIAMSLTLVPQFGVENISSQEYIFIIDRSGSMSDGARMKFAKNTLQILLKSLPENGTFFNIVGFGSSCELWQPKSLRYEQTSLQNAVKHVNEMDCNMGGTEIVQALRKALDSISNAKIPVALFILTDGEVYDDAVQSAAAIIRNALSRISRDSSKQRYLRVFTLGIGDAASTALCQDLARAGNGICYMARENEDISRRCANLLNAARVPPLGSLYGLSVDWGYRGGSNSFTRQAEVQTSSFSFFDESLPTDSRLLVNNRMDQSFDLPPPPNVLQAPTTIPDIYPYNRYTVSAILSETTRVPETVIIQGRLPDGSTMQLPIRVNTVNTSPLLHTLAARRLILELEDGDISSIGHGLIGTGDMSFVRNVAKNAVVQLGQDYHLASEYTAFIAIDNESRVIVTETQTNEANDGGGPIQDSATANEYVSHQDDREGGFGPSNSGGASNNSPTGIRFVAQSVPLGAPSSVNQTPNNGLVSQIGNHGRENLNLGTVRSSGRDEGFQRQNVQSRSFQRDGAVLSSQSPPSYQARRGLFMRDAQDESQRITEPLPMTDTPRTNVQREVKEATIWRQPLRTLWKTVRSVLNAVWSSNKEKPASRAPIEADAPASEPHSYMCSLEIDEKEEMTESNVDPCAMEWLDFMKVFEGRPQTQTRFRFDEAYTVKDGVVGVRRSELQDGEEQPRSAYYPSQKTVVDSNESVSRIACVQAGDGSFQLNDNFVSLFSAKLQAGDQSKPGPSRVNRTSITAQRLRDSIPFSLRSNPNAESLWATVVMSVYLKNEFSDKTAIWARMWEKAAGYVTQYVPGGRQAFAQLEEEAMKLL